MVGARLYVCVKGLATEESIATASGTWTCHGRVAASGRLLPEREERCRILM